MKNASEKNQNHKTSSVMIIILNENIHLTIESGGEKLKN